MNHMLRSSVSSSDSSDGSRQTSLSTSRRGMLVTPRSSPDKSPSSSGNGHERILDRRPVEKRVGAKDGQNRDNIGVQKDNDRVTEDSGVDIPNAVGEGSTRAYFQMRVKDRIAAKSARFADKALVTSSPDGAPVAESLSQGIMTSARARSLTLEV